MEMYDLVVEKVCKLGEEVFKVGKERGVIKSPGACLIKVPAGKRKGVSDSKPVTMDLEICTPVRWNQEEFEA